MEIAANVAQTDQLITATNVVQPNGFDLRRVIITVDGVPLKLKGERKKEKRRGKKKQFRPSI